MSPASTRVFLGVGPIDLRERFSGLFAAVLHRLRGNLLQRRHWGRAKALGRHWGQALLATRSTREIGPEGFLAMFVFECVMENGTGADQKQCRQKAVEKNDPNVVKKHIHCEGSVLVSRVQSEGSYCGKR